MYLSKYKCGAFAYSYLALTSEVSSRLYKLTPTTDKRGNGICAVQMHPQKKKEKKKKEFSRKWQLSTYLWLLTITSYLAFLLNKKKLNKLLLQESFYSTALSQGCLWQFINPLIFTWFSMSQHLHKSGKLQMPHTGTSVGLLLTISQIMLTLWKGHG